MATAKQRQIWFWQKEVEARLFAWKENLKNGDSEGAKQAKRLKNWEVISSEIMA